MIENFNDLPEQKRLEIYKSLRKKFSIPMLSHFFDCYEPFGLYDDCSDYKKVKDFNEQHWEILNKFFFIDSLPEHKKTIIANIIKDTEHILQGIKEVNDNNGIFDITIALAGGSLRDLFLMDEPQIKDLDLIVSFNYHVELLKIDFNNGKKNENLSKEVFVERVKKANIYFKQQGVIEFDISNISEKDTINSLIQNYLIHISSQFFKNKYPNSLEIISKPDVQPDLLDGCSNFGSEARFLNGVIKIEDRNLHYPVDILLTSVNLYSYMNSFDFEICKMHAVLFEHNNYKLKQNNDFYNLIHFSEFIYDDILNNTLTFNVNGFSTTELERSLSKHYLQVNKKYPHLKLNILHNEYFNTDYLAKVVHMAELSVSLKNTEESIPSKKRVKI